VRILDAGCGTGQLALYLSMMNRRVVAIDFSHASLKKGHEFREKFGLRMAHFAQMDLFWLRSGRRSFDYVFCNGVLHHTADAAGGFRILCGLVKRGGYLVVGLYNRYARLPLRTRRLIFRLTRGRLLWLDFFMRQPTLEPQKKQIWLRDQYHNPHEERFSVDDVLGWFRQNNVEHVSSVPKVRLGEPLTSGEWLFEPHDSTTRVERFLSQLAWMFTTGREGGFFITIGRKR